MQKNETFSPKRQVLGRRNPNSRDSSSWLVALTELDIVPPWSLQETISTMAWNLEDSAVMPGKLKGGPKAPPQASSKSTEDGKQNVHRANAPNSLTSDAGSTPATTGSEGSSRPEGQKSTGSPGSIGGGLADYFSALFDESFCSHKYKFVG